MEVVNIRHRLKSALTDAIKQRDENAASSTAAVLDEELTNLPLQIVERDPGQG